MDVNNLDTYLKEKLHRDLIFRSIIWITISLIVISASVHFHGMPAIDFFVRVSDSQYDVVNSFGIIALNFSILALLLKDLEQITINIKTKRSTSGIIGGFVRRVAGDTTLWLLGMLQALLAAFLTAVIFTDGIFSVWPLLFFFAIYLVTIIFITAFLNIQVRRNGSSFFHKIIVEKYPVEEIYILRYKFKINPRKAVIFIWISLLLILNVAYLLFRK